MSVLCPANEALVFVASGMYCPILLAPDGPRPGSVVTNFLMFVGLWAKAHARGLIPMRAAAPALAFKNCRLFIEESFRLPADLLTALPRSTYVYPLFRPI